MFKGFFSRFALTLGTIALSLGFLASAASVSAATVVTPNPITLCVMPGGNVFMIGPDFKSSSCKPAPAYIVTVNASGVPGPQGPQGPVGPVGPQGPKGDKGDT